MSPKQRYQADIDSGTISRDVAQLQVVERLEALFTQLTDSKHVPFWQFWKKTEAIQGVYLWGGVGRGKTYLMDLLVHSLPEAMVKRMHFHRFMAWVHEQLKAVAGEKNPLDTIIRDFAKQTRVLCFDEFFVEDIGDAMVLAGVLNAMFARGMVLVTTSNRHPKDLYKNGLQRQRFLPAIALLEKHTQVIELASEMDYRLRTLTQAPLYYSPINDNTRQKLTQAVDRLALDDAQSDPLTILGRDVSVVARYEKLIWFDFEVICQSPRNQTDYLEIAKCFHTIVISDVPALSDAQSDMVKRFIHLVDVFYDRHVILLILAERPILELYRGERLAFQFERTESRLQEMQSEDYLSLGHLS